MFSKNFYLSNHQSNFAHLQTNEAGNFKNTKLQRVTRASISIKKPLIVVVGISIYDNNVFPTLECVPIDYKNIQYAFNVVRGYDMAFYNPKNQLVVKRHKIGSENKVSSKSEFKLRWNEKEVFKFNDAIYEKLNDSRYNYDCLLYFISCHGDRGGVIYDSNGNKIPLITIFDKFSNQNCIKLRNKPKIYFIEACRGKKRTKRYANSNFEKTDEKHQTLQGVGNNNKTKTYEPFTSSHETTMEIEDKSNDEDNISNTESVNVKTVATLNNNKSKACDNMYSKYNYNREIYANTEGYVVPEPGSKGAYMIRSITQSIVKNEIFCKSFDEIMIQSRKIMLKLMGTSIECAAQVIDDHNNIPNKIIFKTNEH